MILFRYILEKNIMFRILCFLVFAVLFHRAYTQVCVPNPVSVLQLDVNGTLYWRPSTNCAGTSYIVYIVDLETEVYYYETNSTYFDISHLPACVDHHFTVVAIANYILSTEQRLTARTPADPDSQSPIISHFSATPEGDGVVLEWDVEPEFAHCVQYFRVVIWDRESVPEDRYPLSRRLVLTSLTPCTNYEFTVTSIYNNGMEGQIVLIDYESPTKVAPSPTVDSIRPGVTFVDMTWRLPTYSTNRCRITSIIADGSPYVNLTIPIADSRERPAVPIHVSPLQPDRMYVFRVSLVNSAGVSTPVPIGIQTTLEN